ncbi:MAG: DUF1795 domain-containing protein [Rhodocyclales bacterium]|nr:DUF1795 domain-containing protein [Rhodocyclales bacterium]
MSYTLNEGTLSLRPTDDRSINILNLARHDEPPQTLVITRDALGPGEVLAAAVTRQIKELSRQVQAFKEHARRDATFGTSALPVVLLETSFKQAGQPTHQCQAIAQLAGDRLLILTLSTPTPVTDGLRAQWLALLDSFQPA